MSPQPSPPDSPPTTVTPDPLADRRAAHARVLDQARRAHLTGALPAGPGAGEARMSQLCDLIWAELGDHRPVSWVGFYLMGEGEMTLGPRRDKPACSPIGLHGACGQAAEAGKTLVVRDVAELGEAYIACDPKDRSEIVVPVRNRDGEVVAVLDMDSFEVGAFGEVDQEGLERLLLECLQGLL